MKRLLLFLFLLIHVTGFAQVSRDTVETQTSSSDTIMIHAGVINGEHRDYAATQAQQWRFTNEDDIAFAQPGFDASSWQKVPSMFYPKEIEQYKPNRVGWFRLVLVVDSTGVDVPSTLILSGQGAASIYLDGKLLRSIGKQKDTTKAEYVQLTKFPAFFTLDSVGVHILAIRYENEISEEYESWGFWYNIDNPEDVFTSFVSNVLYSLSALLPLGSLFFTLFLVHLLIFLYYRKEVFNLHFAIFCLSIAIVIFSIAFILQSDKGTQHYVAVIYCLQVCAVAGFYAISSFCTRLFSRANLFYYIIIGLAILTIAVIFITRDPDGELTGYCLLALALVSVVYSLVLIIKAIVTKKKGAKVLGFGILFFFGFIAVVIVMAIVNNGEISTRNNVLGAVLIASAILAVFSIPISISSYLAWRFADTNKSLERQLLQVETLSQQQLEMERDKQHILENQKEALEREVAIRTEDLQQEKKKSDDLLLNILPHEIAEELKATGKSKAQLYDEVSVIFTDFVNFTQISEKLGVDELLEELNINFTAFDRIMEKYGLEKIKTIGDAYLAVSGLPAANEQHAENAVLAALDIIEFVSERKKQVTYGLDIRIGINSGSLIAGIIGVKKFAYDIWGDTVNIAARMEQSSAPGKVNISESTYQLVKDNFECAHRGKIDAKHKGEMDMYFVKGKR